MSASRPLAAEERTLILLLAFLHLQHGAPQKAEILYAALLALEPQDAEAAKGLGGARLAMGKPQEALSALDAVIGPGEPSAIVQLLRARAFVRLGRVDDARVAMRAFGALRRAALPERRPAPVPVRAGRAEPVSKPVSKGAPVRAGS